METPEFSMMFIADHDFVMTSPLGLPRLEPQVPRGRRPGEPQSPDVAQHGAGAGNSAESDVADEAAPWMKKWGDSSIVHTYIINF